MTPTATIHAHITYELIDDYDPIVVVVEFLSQDIVGFNRSRELGDQLDSLIRPELPDIVVMDFGNVRWLGSTAFGEIVAFARKSRRLFICNMDRNLLLGAALIGLDDYVETVADRHEAIREAKRAAMRSEWEDDTREAAELTLDDFGGRSDALGG
jgi:hypothetical protein